MKAKDKVVIFDMDGVIVDSMHIALASAQKIRNGFTREDMQSAFHLRPPNIGMRDFDHKLKFGAVDDRKGSHTPEYVKYKVRVTELFEGMDQVIKALSEKVQLVVNTNSRGETPQLLLEKFGLREYFEIVSNENAVMSKVESNEYILKELGIEPHNAVYITDATGDVIESRESGIKSIGVSWGIHDRSHFEDLEIIHDVVGIAENPNELLALISGYLHI